jgi:hypothetical protein
MAHFERIPLRNRKVEFLAIISLRLRLLLTIVATYKTITTILGLIDLGDKNMS